MNHNKKKLVALLALSGLQAIDLAARTSNIAYQVGADLTTYAGRPMMDPTAGTNAVSADILSATGAKSIFGLSVLDAGSAQMFLAETTSTSLGKKSLVKAKADNDVVRLTSIATDAPTVTFKNNVSLTNDQTGKLATPFLQGKIFDRIALAGTNKVALRNASTKADLYIVNGTDGSTILQINATDGNAGKANIDHFIEADGKLVCGLFQNGSGTTGYRNSAPLDDNLDFPHGRIRVLDISTGSQIGVAKKLYSGSYAQELQIHAGTVTTNNYNLQGLITSGNKEIEEIGAMYWDPTLKRLFIAFSRSASKPLTSQNIAPFLVGRFADGTETGAVANDLLVEPFAPYGATTNANSKIVSFYDDEEFSIPFLNMMHVQAKTTDGTSIDNPYLIAQINYDISSDLVPATTKCGRIFAIPVVSSSSALAADLGKAANMDSITSATPATLGQLHPQDPTFATDSDVRALVGGAKVPVLAYSDIKAIQVVGHTVFVGVIGASAAAQVGIWASTAIIDESGVIKGWTPWTRAYGIYEQVFGLGIDSKTGKAWVVHSDVRGATATSVAGVTIPDFKSALKAPRNVDGTLPVLQNWDPCGLGSIADKIKKDLSGKIFCSRQFKANRVPGLSTKSLLAIGGEGQLSLAVVGTAADASLMDASTATTNRDFEADIAGDTPNYTLYQCFDSSNQDALSALGNIYCVEVARSRAANQGWLFVGGDNGLVVFSNDSNGNGWNSDATVTTALNNLKTVFSTLTAKKINSSTTPISGPVIALQAVSKQTGGSANADDATCAFLLVLTKTGLYRVPMSAANFLNATTAGDISTIQKLALPNFASDERCLSLKMLSHHANSLTGGAACGVMLTTKGVYILNDLEKAQSTAEAGINKVSFADNDFSSRVRNIEILPRSPYNNALLNSSGTTTVANLVITTGTLTYPESEIYVLPLHGTQLVGFTAGNSRQSAYTLDTTVDSLTPLLLASSSNLGSSKVFGTTTLSYAPFCAHSGQYISGSKTNSHIDVIGQLRFASLGELSISSMTVNSGGNGGLILTDRSGKIISQE